MYCIVLSHLHAYLVAPVPWQRGCVVLNSVAEIAVQLFILADSSLCPKLLMLLADRMEKGAGGVFSIASSFPSLSFLGHRHHYF